jgi:hypothetical protein
VHQQGTRDPRLAIDREPTRRRLIELGETVAFARNFEQHRETQAHKHCQT